IGQLQHIGFIFRVVFLSHLLHPFCVLLYHLGCAVLVYHSRAVWPSGGRNQALRTFLHLLEDTLHLPEPENA
ncbi:hypothetical protein, partial [Flavonifractor sp. An52]|uniref:hypothetical protein n=1 Tax=Flavonifractor sp. An52 TaxID=1965642 RepID=UPI0019527BC3